MAKAAPERESDPTDYRQKEVDCMAKALIKVDSVEGIDLTRGKSVEYVRRWRTARKELLQRADELIKQAEIVRKNNPERAAELMERSRALSTEAEKMLKESRKGLSSVRVHLAAVRSEISLFLDKERHRK